MKKLLSILASVSMIVSGSSSIMAMSQDTKNGNLEINNSQLSKPSIEKENQIPMNVLKVIEVPKMANVAYKSFSSVIIKNFNDLTNIKVKTANPEIVTVTIIDNLVQFYGVQKGATTITVSADDAEDAYITVTVKDLKKIDVDQNVETYISRTNAVSIKNASELTGIFAQSIDEKVATVSKLNNTLRIFGISQGTTTIIVSADDAEDAYITVTVKNLKTIQVDHEEASIIIGKMVDFKITNFEDLIDVSVKADNPQIASVTMMDDLIVVKGIGKGNTNIRIKAFNGLDKTITVTVNDLMTIEVDKNAVNLYPSSTEEVKITNFSDLDEVNVQIKDNQIATVDINNEGIITVKGIKQGTTSVIILANDATPKEITVTVNDLKVIDVDKTAEVYAKETTNVIIKNAEELIGVTAKSSDEQTVTVSVEGNKIMISGLKVNQAEVTISANNAKEVTIIVTVKDLKTITVNREANVVSGDRKLLEIMNFQELNDVSVKSADKEIATAGLLENSVLIMGKKEGKVEITVSAYRSWDAVITVTVSPLQTIIVDKEKVIVDEKGTENVQITNFVDLTNVKVQSQNNSIATVVDVNNEGIITVQGNKTGSTTITITAGNAKALIIPVEVQELDKILVDKESVVLYDTSSLPQEFVKITNYFDLTNVEVKSSNENVAKIKFYNSTGSIGVIRSEGTNVGDKTSIEITANHAEKHTISVIIGAQSQLTDAITTLALDSDQENQVIAEVIKRNPNLTKNDIKIKAGSFKAPDSVNSKLGEVIIKANNSKYTGEIKLLIVPKMKNDQETKKILENIKNGADLNERKPYWKQYFERKGNVFFKDLMPNNPWSFQESDFIIDEMGNKQIKDEAFKLIARYWDAIMQRLLQRDYAEYGIKTDYSSFSYNITSYKTNVDGKNVVINFSGFYGFKFDDNSNMNVPFIGDVKGTISD